jgi:hypothetical protein
MKKSSKPSQAVWLILAGLVCFVVIPLLAGSQAWAASPAGPTMLAQATPAKGASTQGTTQAPTKPQSPASPITPYVASGYSIVGPIYVSSVSSQDIVLSTGANNLGIDLTGKKVTLIDQNYRPLSLSAVQKGTRVYVCRRDNNVVVIVLPAMAETGANK